MATIKNIDEVIDQLFIIFQEVQEQSKTQSEERELKDFLAKRVTATFAKEMIYFPQYSFYNKTKSIIEDYRKNNLTPKELAQKYKVTLTAVYSVLRGR